MKIFSFIGKSGSGKTRLVSRLVSELKRRGLKVAVVKHCSHGFDLGGSEKDSSRFLAAGADEVALAAPERNVVLREATATSDLEFLARREFSNMDMVLVEGGKSIAGLSKVEVFRQEISQGFDMPREDACAVVSDYPVACGLPVFHPDEIDRLSDWLLSDFHKGSEPDKRAGGQSLRAR